MTNGAKIRDEIVFNTLQEELVGPCAYGMSIGTLIDPPICGVMDPL